MPLKKKPNQIKKKSWLLISFFAVLLSFSSSQVRAEEAELSGIISQLEITGNRLVSDEEIKENILISPGIDFNKNFVVEDLKNIYSLGYFKAKSVEARPYRKPDGTLLIEYSVEENLPINDLIVYGNYSMDTVDVYAFFNDLIAKPENAKLLGDKIKALERKYLEEGYILAKVVDIELDDSGTLKIYIDEGQINNIVYKGNEKTQESYLNRIVSQVKVNEAYNERKFAKDYKRLQGTGYFSTISRTVVPSKDKANGYDLEIQLAEKRTVTLGLGGGINSNAGLFGNANASIGNIRGRGETVNINALLGSGLGAGSSINNSNLVRRSQYTQLSIKHSIPYYLGSDYNFTKSLSYNRGPNFLVDIARQNLLSIGGSFSRSIGNNHSFSLGANANSIKVTDRDRKEYIDEVARNIIDVDGLKQRDILDARGDKFLGGRLGIARAEARKLRNEQIVEGYYFGIRPGYSYANLDNNRSPRDGWKTRISLNPNLGLDEVTSFTKMNFSTTRFFPIKEKSSFLVNLRGGYELFGELPQFSKYRLGSNLGVRGYRQFSELGVGNKLLISTAEFRTPIYHVIPPLEKYSWMKNIDFALFADAGAIGGDKRLNNITDRLSQAASVGFGIRVKVPLIGALRIDLGFPLVTALTDNNKFYRFNFGPANIF